MECGGVQERRRTCEGECEGDCESGAMQVRKEGKEGKGREDFFCRRKRACLLVILSVKRERERERDITRAIEK
jgi:hypothetical protein